MAELWKDSFDHYGEGAEGLAALAGMWTYHANTELGAPSAGARTGDQCLGIGQGTGFKRVLGGDFGTIIMSFGYYLESLPGDSLTRIAEILNSGGNRIAWLGLTSDGRIRVMTGQAAADDVQLAVASSPSLAAATWHHIEVKFVLGPAGSGSCEVRVDEEVDVTASALTWKEVLSGTTNTTGAQVNFCWAAGGAAQQWLDDVIIRDSSGTRNNDFEGSMRVATLFPDENEAAQGWTPRYRKYLGTGILANNAANSCISAASAAALQIGAADFTFEAAIRFEALPTLATKAVIGGKWQESGDQREWQLYKAGPNLDSGHVVFRTSTDGAAGTVSNKISWPYEFELYRWYHVAVARVGTEVMLFVDGVMQGPPQSGNETYHAGTGNFVVGGEMSSTTAVVADTCLDGWIDEVRFTNGVGRYSADFAAPSAEHGRTVGADADFASVVALLGFNSAITDESSYARTFTARGSAAQHTVDDGTAAYQTINNGLRDDTSIEARFLSATGIFQLDAAPTAAETVTVGGKTYTFRAAVGVTANEVLIEATADLTLSNLVAAINAGAGSGTKYGSDTTANAQVSAEQLPEAQIKVTALTAGAAGNAIASTETCADGEWLNGATLEGGEDKPSHSEFNFEPLTEEATIVRSITMVHRAYKSNAGTAKIKVSQVDVNNNVVLGTERSLTTTPTYREEVFDTDATSGGGMTPSYVAGLKVRVDRTE